MIELIIFENYTVQWNPILFNIREYKAIWTRDRSKSKEKAFRELSYVAFFLDYRSPYVKEDEGVRTVKLVKDLGFPQDWRPDKVVKDAMHRYKEDFKTPATVSLDSLYGILAMTNTSIRYITESIKEAYELLEVAREMDIEDGDYKDESERGKNYVDYASRIATLAEDLHATSAKLVVMGGKFPPLIDQIGKLKNAIKQEQSESNSVKGGGTIGDFET